MNASCNSDELDDLFFDYIARANPKSNDDLKRYLRLYPQFSRSDNRIHRDLARAVDRREGPATGTSRSDHRAAAAPARSGTL